MVFKSDEQLELYVGLKLKNALHNTLNVLLNELQNIIETTVYSYSLNGEWQNRTGQFKESWSVQQPYYVDGWYNTISQDGFNYIYNGTSGQWSHGSPYSTPSGALNINSLNDIINDGLTESNFGFPAIESRQFWNTFERYVNENLHNVFFMECLKLGIPIQKV